MWYVWCVWNKCDWCVFLFVVVCHSLFLFNPTHPFITCISVFSSILCPCWQTLLLVWTSWGWRRKMIAQSWCPSTPRPVFLLSRYLSPSSQATSVRKICITHRFNELIKEIMVSDTSILTTTESCSGPRPGCCSLLHNYYRLFYIMSNDLLYTSL